MEHNYFKGFISAWPTIIISIISIILTFLLSFTPAKGEPMTPEPIITPLEQVDTEKLIQEQVQAEANRIFSQTINTFNLLLAILVVLIAAAIASIWLLRKAIITEVTTIITYRLQELQEWENEVSSAQQNIATMLEKSQATVEEIDGQAATFQQQLAALSQSHQLTLKTLEEQSQAAGTTASENITQLEQELALRLQQIQTNVESERDKLLEQLKAISPQSLATIAFKDSKENILAQLEKLTNLQTNHPELFYSAEHFLNRGNQLLSQNNYPEAIKNYDKALELQPNNSQVSQLLYNKAIALQKSNLLEPALIAFNQLIQIEPENSQAYLNRGTTLRKLRRYADAIASYDRALAINPDYPQAWVDRGVALGMSQKHQQALESFDRAINLRSHDGVAWLNRGMALEMLEKYSEAISSLDKAIELEPKSAKAWNYRGYVLMKQERDKEAIESFDQAIALQPNYSTAHYNKAACYALRRELVPAVKSLKRAIELNPKYRSEVKNDPDFDGIANSDRFWQSLN